MSVPVVQWNKPNSFGKKDFYRYTNRITLTSPEDWVVDVLTKGEHLYCEEQQSGTASIISIKYRGNR